MTSVLLDTNVWVSAFLSPEGHCGRLVHRLLGVAAADAVVSAPLLEELTEVLERPVWCVAMGSPQKRFRGGY